MRIKSYLTDVHYQDLLHVVLIYQAGLLIPGLLVIPCCLVFPASQEDLQFPFFLSYHLVREVPGDQ